MEMFFADGCKSHGRSTASSSKHPVEEDSCFVSKINCHHNVRKHLQGFLPTHTIISRLSLEKAAPGLTFTKMWSYHSCRISLILLHMLEQCFLTHSISTSLGSRQAYCICIQLVTPIVLYPHKTCQCPLPRLWLSLDG
jgi:hypothetical protein